MSSTWFSKSYKLLEQSIKLLTKEKKSKEIK